MSDLRCSRCNPSTDGIKDGFGILSLPFIFFPKKTLNQKKKKVTKSKSSTLVFCQNPEQTLRGKKSEGRRREINKKSK